MDLRPTVEIHDLFPDYVHPPCPELFQCNTPPSPDQLLAIQQVIKVAERNISELRCLESTALPPDLTLEAVREERHFWKQYLKEHQKLVHSAPMRSIPTEIWQEIFRYYVWMDFDSENTQLEVVQARTNLKGSRFGKIARVCSVFQNSFPPPDLGFHRPRQSRTLRAPFVLTHVCRSWRTIALGEPFLWSFIRCQIPSPTELVTVWLARSQNRPLYIRVSTTRRVIGGFDGLTSVQARKFMHDVSLNNLLWHCRRWVEADLNLWSGRGQLEEVLRRINGAGAPMLRRLHTRASILYGQNLSDDHPLSVNGLTQLTDLTWASDDLQDILAFPRYPNLTRFSGAFYTVQSLSEIFLLVFESMPELIDLELGVQNRFVFTPETDLYRWPSVVHERLSSLKLEWFGKHDEATLCRVYIDRFLERVSFPLLTKFSLSCSLGDGEPDVLSGFLSRHTKLEDLVFSLPDYDMHLMRAVGDDHDVSTLVSGSFMLPWRRTGPFDEITLPPGKWVML
ncbi:hypothetical protein K435DRAFT_56098 [Dendrothele bispora CBS 962.96]|uniref:F-box domain-containing protein n=1 Tax=Dendrothele bispora (strain CBS 962.96) TaxID=1314807 RepID=A0A4S8M5Y8_DENBC|nr:hypothetical protein K435DRAFT_56098 [Dendrothele bispora CBS 962.96]